MTCEANDTTVDHYRKVCVVSSWDKTRRMLRVHAAWTVSASQSRFQSRRGWNLWVLVHEPVWWARCGRAYHLYTTVSLIGVHATPHKSQLDVKYVKQTDQCKTSVSANYYTYTGCANKKQSPRKNYISTEM